MINRSTLEKLTEMNLTGMSDAFRHQLSDPRMNDVAFEDRFGMMVDIEYNRRKNNRLDRLIKNANFDQPDANIMDIDYRSGRKLNKELIMRLAVYHRSQKHLHHRCNRNGQELSGMCIWYGSL